MGYAPTSEADRLNVTYSQFICFFFNANKLNVLFEMTRVMCFVRSNLFPVSNSQFQTLKQNFYFFMD